MRFAQLGSIVVAFVIGGLATAVVQAHGGDANQVHGCINQAGYLRIVGPDAECKESETALDWGIVGPQGAAGRNGADGQDGAHGADGADGADGQNGANGVSGYEIVTQTASWGGGGINRWMYLQCPPGKKAFGAGFDGPPAWEIKHSTPSADGTQWIYDVWGDFAGSPSEFVGYVICATGD